jgi:uncharacterized membrane protein
MTNAERSGVTRQLALAAYLMLLGLVVGWELFAAAATPVPRAFWVAVKAVPLLIPLYWLVRDSANAHVVAALLVLVYFCDGVAAAYIAAKMGPRAQLVYAAAEIFATVLFIGAATLYARHRLRSPRAQDSG